MEGSRGFVVSPVSRHFWKRLKGFPSELSAAGTKRGVRSLPVKSVSSWRSTLAQPTEGRPGPCDDNDGGDDGCENQHDSGQETWEEEHPWDQLPRPGSDKIYANLASLIMSSFFQKNIINSDDDCCKV